MKCPKCGVDEDRVLDSRSARDGAAIRRRRECTKCGHRFTTYEEIDREIADRHKPMVALMRDEALGAFRMWEESTEKTEY